MGDLKVSMSAGSLGVDDSLRNPLSVELRHLVDEVEVLQQHGASGPCSH